MSYESYECHNQSCLLIVLLLSFNNALMISFTPLPLPLSRRRRYPCSAPPTKPFFRVKELFDSLHPDPRRWLRPDEKPKFGLETRRGTFSVPPPRDVREMTAVTSGRTEKQTDRRVSTRRWQRIVSDGEASLLTPNKACKTCYLHKNR